MKSTIIALAFFAAFSAQAECVMRSTSLTKVVGKLDDIADIRAMTFPAANGEVRCSISVRVLYKGRWDTTYGEYTGPAEIGDQDLCVNAVEIAARQFLASKESKLLHSEQQMFCSDEEPIKVRSVQKGEVIKLSEVMLNTKKPEFLYKGALCKWFTETTTKGSDLYQWNGIICRLNPKVEDWTVVDKF